MRKETHNINNKSMRQIVTAVKKFCNLSPLLHHFRSKHRLVTALSYWIRKRGPQGLADWKCMMTFAIRCVLRTKSPNPRPPFKVPRWVIWLIRKGRKDFVTGNAVISIFSTYRYVRLRPAIGVQTIESPFTGHLPDVDSDFNLLTKVCAVLKKEWSLDHYSSWDPVWHTSFASGPNTYYRSHRRAQAKLWPQKSLTERDSPKGSKAVRQIWSQGYDSPNVFRTPSWDCVHEDLTALDQSGLSAFVHRFVKSSPRQFGAVLEADLRKLRVVLQRQVKDYILPEWGKPTWWDGLITRLKLARTFSEIKSALDSVECFRNKGKYCHSKLAFLSDKGGKTRVIALGDVVTQTLFTPVHKRCFGVLRKLAQDGTFDQDKQRLRIKDMTLSNKKLYSIDMTACTDRLPAFYQMAVLWRTGILTLEQSLSWYCLATKRHFKVTGKPDTSYSVGQPMGFLSSWAVMAVSHHVLVRWASKEASYTNYSVLGDDVVIFDEVVALRYKDILTSFGVGVSKTKSFEEVGTAEFAKSFFRKGKDYKPISTDLLVWSRLEGPAKLVAVGLELDRKGLGDKFKWLQSSFSSLATNQIVTLLYVNNVYAFLARKVPLERKYEYFASVWEQNREFVRSFQADEMRPYQALRRKFSSDWAGRTSGRTKDRLEEASLLWKEHQKVGPAWAMLVGANSTHRFSLMANRLSPQQFRDLSEIIVGNNWIMWNPAFWGPENPMDVPRFKSLSGTTHASLRFQPLRIRYGFRTLFRKKPSLAVWGAMILTA